MCVSVCESFVWLWLKVHQKLKQKEHEAELWPFFKEILQEQWACI